VVLTSASGGTLLARGARTIGLRIAETKSHTAGFDVLRITLAVAVLCWHGIFVSYGQDYADTIWASPLRVLPSLVLPMFFALSGYLIAGSLFRSRTLAEFFVLRVLRLMPALFVEVCLSALVLGPLVTNVSWSSYFSGKQFFSYWGNIVGHIQFRLPGVFEDNPVSGFVNASLWTVPVELECYIALGLLAAISITRKPAVLFLLFIGASVAFPCFEFYKWHGWPWTTPANLLLVLSFLAGLLLYVGRDHVPLRRDLFGLSVLVSIAALTRPDTCYLSPLPIAYATVYIGLLNPPRIPVLMSGDYSYGVYLYAFPIQQTFCWAFPSYRVWWLNILIALPATLAMAAFSWNIVEKPVLGRKKFLTSLITQQIANAKRQVQNQMQVVTRPTRQPAANATEVEPRVPAGVPAE
jgi:peptidoglycan/LPS O-acetylase OafA/YrhL